MGLRDLLSELNIDLNLPPFMEGQKELPAQEVKKGREIASLRIHVERTISWMKTYSIYPERHNTYIPFPTSQPDCLRLWMADKFSPLFGPSS